MVTHVRVAHDEKVPTDPSKKLLENVFEIWRRCCSGSVEWRSGTQQIFRQLELANLGKTEPS
jgi:hypothetical protein